ncbi:MAG: creatininase family protein [Alphaproteobacteria bacterium]|nr:creatininase family protein [Alphaproteobacteria bacterium]
MRLQLMTWMEVEAYLKRDRGIIIPIGSTEQHGPIGLIGTDAICPEVIADRAAEELGCVVGPTLSIGMAQHHLAFPGSIALRPTTLIAVIKDTVLSLARNGFERFYFLNGHGGNIPTTAAAFSEIHAERSLNPGLGRPAVRCKLASWFAFQSVSTLCKELYGDRDGHHATASEVAVTQFAYPEHIKSVPMDPAPPRPRPFYDADDYRSIHPDGRIAADSFLATPEAGGRLVAASATAVIEDYRAFMAEV